MTQGPVFDCLKEWATRYVRHRDIAANKIAEIRTASFGILVVNKDTTSISCVVQPSLESFNADDGAIQGKAIIVTLNNEDNIRAVYKMWDKLAAKKELLMLFVNPFSGLEEKWLLKPYIHGLVCDKSSLLQGLRTMAELVEPTNEGAMLLKMKEQI